MENKDLKEQARGLSEKARPGKWGVTREPLSLRGGEEFTTEHICSFDHYRDDRVTGEREANAQFIVACVNYVRALLADSPAPEADKPFAYACPVKCGCIWRDNEDGTMSLFGKNSKSCEVCEYLPLSKLIPLYAAAPQSEPFPERAHRGMMISDSKKQAEHERIMKELADPAAEVDKRGEKE